MTPPLPPNSPQNPMNGHTTLGGSRPEIDRAGDAGGRARRLWLARAGDAAADGGDNFDALTDLFLGEVGRHRRDTTSQEPERSTEAESRPRLRLAGLGPEDEPEAETAPAETDAVMPPTQTKRETLVECLVVGNLPVLASAWASQYVREVARASECAVAFLRVQAGFVTLELVGGEGMENGASMPVHDLDAALTAAAHATHRWVVRVDPADETAAAGRASMRLVTLITGPDDAARLNAYGTLKELAARLPAEHGPMVRVAVMSTSSQHADAAGRKVVETVRQHLGREVQHAVCSAKIAASRPARLLFNGKLDCPVSAIIERLEAASGGTPGVVVDHRAAMPATAATVSTPTETPVAAEMMDEPVAVEPVMDELIESPPAAVTPEPKSPAEPPAMARAAAHVERKPIEPRREAAAVVAESIIASTVSTGESQAGTVETVVRGGLIDRIAPASHAARHEPVAGRVDDVALWSAGAAAAGEGTPRLTSLVAGLNASAVRCPYADGVDVAVDAAGRVHLLVRSGGAADDDRALASLMVAGAWLDAHAAMLRAVDARVADARGGSRVMHLFTSTPKSSRRLLETDVRVHVLARVDVGGRSGWCCVDLN